MIDVIALNHAKQKKSVDANLIHFFQHFMLLKTSIEQKQIVHLFTSYRAQTYFQNDKAH